MWTLLLALVISTKRCLKEINYRVGWCTNARTLPDNTSGEFIFYGKKSNAEPQYLDFSAFFDTTP